MFEFQCLLVFQLAFSTHSYHLQCPDISQRIFRASGYCTSRLRSKYTCLYDTNMLSYSEQCNRNPDFVTPGEKYVISGNLRNVDCSSERYQPFRLWSNVSGECLNKKSLCEGKGQVIFSNGSLIEERTCRCDYTKGYKFIKRPKQNCSCNPLEEDCSCYISECPGGSVLTADYECVEEMHHDDSNCPLIIPKRGGLQIQKNQMNIENGKQLRTSLLVVSAMIVLIIAYIVIVFVLLNVGRSKGKSDEVEDCRTPKYAETIESTPTNETHRLVRSEPHKPEIDKILVEDSSLNAQQTLKEEALTKTNLELKQVVESQDAKILELQNLIQKRDEDMKNKERVFKSKIIEIENKEKEMMEKEKMREEKTRDQIRKLEKERRDLHNKFQELKGNIRVICRVRPLLDNEKQGNNCKPNHISFPGPTKMEVVMNEKKETREFIFDKVFKHNATQEQVFEEISQLIQSALDGYNVCIFAYGQTGSGKTYTMEGKSITDDTDDVNRGMIPRSVQKIFDTIKKLTIKGWEYSVDVSCLEIYGEKINDLLSNKKDGQTRKIQHFNNETRVTNITIKQDTTEKELYILLQKASQKREVAETNCNKNSSRSHSVYTLKLRGENSSTEETSKSTLYLVDLAGSENTKISGAEGQQMKEAIAINQSLTSLGRVIRAIKDKQNAIPYRDYKLTELLQYAIGGNSKTLMFVNISPRVDCVKETLNSLTFATEANKCTIGVAQKNQ